MSQPILAPRKFSPQHPAEVAQAFWGPAFGALDRPSLEQGMSEWVRMSEAEQRFAIAHLLFLNLQVTHGIQVSNRGILHRLEDMREDVELIADDVQDRAVDRREPHPEEREPEMGPGGLALNSVLFPFGRPAPEIPPQSPATLTEDSQTPGNPDDDGGFGEAFDAVLETNLTGGGEG